ncbi:hypothetical protein QW180_17345 [Vibrio sinaloensis]|nr:hypothetical protein [Vibrio sinaloensis]
MWVNQTNDETDKTISKDNRFIWGGHAALRYRLNTRWDLEAEAEFLRSDVLDEEIYTLKSRLLPYSKDQFRRILQTSGARFCHRQ